MSAEAAMAVDGGQTGIRIRVGRAGSRPVVIETQGLGRLEGDVVAGLIGRLREGLQRLPGAAPRIGRMVCGLTAIPPEPDARTQMARQLAVAFSAEQVDVTGDALTAHAGAFSGETGVVLTVGTGIACLGLDIENGVLRKVDGDGFLLGDAGSAFWLGSRGVEAALRAGDGRGEPTTLSAACRDRYGAHEDLAAWLHSRERAVAEIAGFAVDVQRAADAGDAVSIGLVASAADELVRTARAGALGLSPSPCPLALSGRAVEAGTALHRAVRARLDRRTDELTLVSARGGPLDGAWALAEGRLGPGYSEFLSTWRQT